MTDSAEKIALRNAFAKKLGKNENAVSATLGYSLPLAIPNETSSTATLTATVSGITSYYQGLTVALRPNFSHVASTTLNINGLGAKPVYYQNNTTSSTKQYTGSIVLLMYETKTTSSGCWKMIYSVDTNTVDQVRASGFLPKAGSTGIYGRNLIMQVGSTGTWVSLTKLYDTNTAHTVSTLGFDPGHILYYSGTSTIASGSSCASNTVFQTCGGIDFRYSSNCGSTLIAHTPLYLVGTIKDDGLFYLDTTTWQAQTLPTTEDGKFYILLGQAYSTTSFFKYVHNPIYYYAGGAIKLYSGVTSSVAPIGVASFTASGTSGNDPKTEVKYAGISFQEVYRGNGPQDYGNVINVRGRQHTGAGQLLLGWEGTDSAASKIWYRNHRDTNAGGQSAWKQLAFTDSTVSSANTLATARTIAISGGATGTATSFNGSANITIPVTGLDMSKATAGTLATGRGGTGRTDGKVTALASTRYIDGVGFTGAADVTHYGTCSTNAATVEKVVACSNYALKTGGRIVVKFTVTNTAASPTLNVNSTGAKAIYYRGAAIGTGYLAANRTYEFIYNGTQYEFLGDINTDTDTKVTQTLTTTNAEYSLLGMADAAATANKTNSTRFSTGMKMNPSTNTLTFDRYKTTNDCSTQVGAAQGDSVIWMPNTAGAFGPLWNYNSTNGTFVLSGYKTAVQLVYLTKANVDAGTNTITKTVTLTDEGGNGIWQGSVTAVKHIGTFSTYGTEATILSAKSAKGERKIISVSEPTNASNSGKVVEISSGGDMIIGAGESPDSLMSEKKASTGEEMYIVSDNNIYFYTGANTYANKKIATLDSSGNLSVAGKISATGGFDGISSSTITASSKVKNFNRTLIADYGSYSGTVDATETTGSGDLSSTSYKYKTKSGLNASNMKIEDVLKKLIEMSHTHSYTKNVHKYNCNCGDCGTNCNCADDTV